MSFNLTLNWISSFWPSSPHNEHSNVLTWLRLQENGNVNFRQRVEWLLWNEHGEQVVSSEFTVRCHCLHKWDLEEMKSCWNLNFKNVKRFSSPLRMTSAVESALWVHRVQGFSPVAQTRCTRLARTAEVFFEVSALVRHGQAVALLATSLKGRQLLRHTRRPLPLEYSDPSKASCCSSTHARERRSFDAAGVHRDRRQHETEPSKLENPLG